MINTYKTVCSLSIFLLASFVCAVGIASAEKRVALVIGNSNYSHTARLYNPSKDSKDIAAALRRLKFDVMEYHDVALFDMLAVMTKFSVKAQKADTAVLYFAGHGMEVGGENWLLPTDVKLLSDVDTPNEALSLSNVMKQMRGTKNLSLVILDACRNNPFTSKMKRTDKLNRNLDRGFTRVGNSSKQGFARVEPEGNILVAYAAREGTLAEDGKAGENSPYATALLEHIETPGLDVRFIFGRVRDSVMALSTGEQIPHIYGSLPGRNVLLKAGPKLPGISQKILADFKIMERVGTKRAFDLFVRKYSQKDIQFALTGEKGKLNSKKFNGKANHEFFEKILGVGSKKRVQQKLASLNYEVGTIDGVFGGQTRSALQKYQKDNNLEQTGFLDFASIKEFDIKLITEEQEFFTSGGKAQKFDADDLEALGENPQIVKVIKCLDLFSLIYGKFGKSFYFAVIGGHWATYQYTLAQRCGGYLVAIGSAAENRFVYDMFANDEMFFQYWYGKKSNYSNRWGPTIGLLQEESAKEPSGGWRWVNGEKITYSNWHSYQPNDWGKGEDYGRFYIGYEGKVKIKLGRADKWDDFKGMTFSFVMEVPEL